MKTSSLLLFLFALGASVSCTQYQTLPGRSVILPETDAPAFRTLCSRPGLQSFEGTWELRQKDVDRMESRFGRLEKLRSSSCCILRGRVRDINAYYRQYVGVVLRGRRFIYINAYAAESSSTLSDQPEVQACDGGDYYWGAFYDVEKGRFEELSFNGMS